MKRSLAFLLLLAGLASAQQLPKVTIPGSSLRSLKSTSTGRAYDLYIHLPTDYEKNASQEYPVLYILDGQWDFKLMDSILGGLVYDKFVPEMIMVGITYSGENADYEGLRAMDLTPTATAQVKGSGGAPNFLKFLKTELIPFMDKTYRTDPAQRTLMGSSYAGLFTVYAAFSDPALFSRYMAGSPAVTYDGGIAMKQEAEYFAAHKDLPIRLYIAVGSAEGLSGPVQNYIKTVSSRGYKGLKLETRVVEGDRHAGNKPEAFNRGLRFLFSN